MEAIMNSNGSPSPRLEAKVERLPQNDVPSEDMNISTEMFHEIPVRIITIDNCKWVPLVDIASGIGYSRSALSDILRRNKEDFEDYSSLRIMRTQAGMRDVHCLNRDGMIALYMKLDTKRIKDPVRHQRIREFKKWAVETIGKVMDGIPVQPTQPAPTSLPEVMDHYMAVAARFSQMTGIPRNEVIDVAMRVVQAKTGEDLELFRQMLVPKKPETIVIQPIVPDTPKWDPLRDFLNECCQQGECIGKGELYSAYVRWCGIYRTPISSKRFAEQVYIHNFRPGTQFGRRVWLGIDLKPNVKGFGLR